MHYYTTYLFDFDYTLADSSRGIVLCYRHVLERHGYAGVGDEAIKRTIGKTLEESFTQLTGVTDPGQLAAWRKEYVQEADRHMTANTVLFPETLDALNGLKAAGARIGIISTKYRYRILELTRSLGLSDRYFDIIVGGEDVQAAKPSPEGLLMALERLDATPAETLYVGDSTVDAQTAQAAGVDFAGITHGVTTADELAAYPHRYILSQLTELLPKAARNVGKKPAKRPVSVWQIVLLVLLLWLGYEEVDSWRDLYRDFTLFPTLWVITLLCILHKRRVLPLSWEEKLRQRLRPLAVRRRAWHIRQIRGRVPAPLSDKPCTCRNCGYVFTGNFCPRCGQSRHIRRFRLKDAPGNILRSLFRVDGRFARTLIDLAVRPGHAMRDYLTGRRINYTPPLAMLFLMTAFYMLTARLIVPELLVQKETAEVLTDSVETDQEKLRTSIAYMEQWRSNIQNEEVKHELTLGIDTLKAVLDRQIRQDSINQSYHNYDFSGVSVGFRSISSRFDHWLSVSPFVSHVWQLLKQWGHGNKALHILLILPLFAVASACVFSRRRWRRYNLMEHFFIQAYIAAQILLISIVAVLFTRNAHVDDLYEIPSVLIFLLFCWDYRQIYLCTWWQSILKILLMFLCSLFIFIALVVAAALVFWNPVSA